MKRILVLLLILLAAGCNEKLIEKPEDLISKPTMVDILYDLAIINAAKATNPNTLLENQVEPMPYIYEQYGIDSLRFVRSDLYYASVPLEYEAIYEAVKARLEEAKSEFDVIKAQRSDSVRQAVEDQRTRLQKEQALRKLQDSAKK